jgi:hypothetical protein
VRPHLRTAAVAAAALATVLVGCEADDDTTTEADRTEQAPLDETGTPGDDPSLEPDEPGDLEETETDDGTTPPDEG